MIHSGRLPEKHFIVNATISAMSDVSCALKKIRPGFYLGKPAILLRLRTKTSLCRFSKLL
jgi:hypothetical protein